MSIHIQGISKSIRNTHTYTGNNSVLVIKWHIREYAGINML